MKYLLNFFVLLIALGLCVVIFPCGILMTLYLSIHTLSFTKAITYLSKTALSIALSLDLLGNVVCRDLFNHTLIKPNSHAFGNNTETISAVLGKNKRTNNLTDLGRALANLLNWLDANHVERAAGDIHTV